MACEICADFLNICESKSARLCSDRLLAYLCFCHGLSFLLTESNEIVNRRVVVFAAVCAVVAVAVTVISGNCKMISRSKSPAAEQELILAGFFQMVTKQHIIRRRSEALTKTDNGPPHQR